MTSGMEEGVISEPLVQKQSGEGSRLREASPISPGGPHLPPGTPGTTVTKSCRSVAEWQGWCCPHGDGTEEEDGPDS